VTVIHGREVGGHRGETVYDAVTCEGERIVLAGKDVLVDLPCSGARALLLTLLALAGAAAICRPAPLQAAAGCLIALVSALAANILRITVPANRLLAIQTC
jgi:hypothetical protein